VMGGRSTRDEHDAESDDECNARLHDESLLQLIWGHPAYHYPAPPALDSPLPL
jgi:hypothetical protein